MTHAMPSINDCIGLIAEQENVAISDVERAWGGQFNALAKVAHQLARNAGWWNDLHTGEPTKRDVPEIFALIHSEITEGFEGWRKKLMDDKLPHRTMIAAELADVLIRIGDYVGSENAHIAVQWRTSYPEVHRTPGWWYAEMHLLSSDAYRFWKSGKQDTSVYWLGELVGMIHCFAAQNDIPIYDVVIEKMAFNINRADHKREARLAPGGKQA